MKLSLEDITADNYEAVCDLGLAKTQEEYLACNMSSLVEAHYNSGYTCKVINLNSTPVDFFMWVQETPTKVSIWRFMVDQTYQNKGIGRKALGMAIEQIKTTPGLCEIEICYNPSNSIAKDFYTSFGFKEVGLDEDDMLAIIKISS
ncbi:GNAT family N-acetyltransferase [Pseudoalteromonas carrageenovora]|uniref:GNAT family N-acetyltransferase n=1 Tax=Pseudoalteromonas carrageenovora TaxID=227 RepID=UPI0026E2E4D1|nr:GNAT family N-acetyltransferase [Pseudoalteromonas carrageenovora]MDO6546368.1 GNAT family N-acetyltransferase [Pseudoalteromonas carrageenovora]MDO6830907.1 GNAT family N-acetyltransferase [Pseudoalteromonas carrageenovora]